MKTEALTSQQSAMLPELEAKLGQASSTWTAKAEKDLSDLSAIIDPEMEHMGPLADILREQKAEYARRIAELEEENQRLYKRVADAGLWGKRGVATERDALALERSDNDELKREGAELKSKLAVECDGRHEAERDRDAARDELEQVKADLLQTQSDRQKEHDKRVRFQGEVEQLKAQLAAVNTEVARQTGIAKDWLRYATEVAHALGRCHCSDSGCYPGNLSVALERVKELTDAEEELSQLKAQLTVKPAIPMFPSDEQRLDLAGEIDRIKNDPEFPGHSEDLAASLFAWFSDRYSAAPAMPPEVELAKVLETAWEAFPTYARQARAVLDLLKSKGAQAERPTEAPQAQRPFAPSDETTSGGSFSGEKWRCVVTAANSMLERCLLNDLQGEFLAALANWVEHVDDLSKQAAGKAVDNG